MLLRNVTRLDGGVRENCPTILTNVFPGVTAEGVLDAARVWETAECTE